MLGFLSHLTFVHAYAAILLWTAYTSWARGRLLARRLSRPSRCHAVPLVFLAALYLVYGRHLRVAGAEPAGLASVIAETMRRHARHPCARRVAAGSHRFSSRAPGRGTRRSGRRDAGLFLLFLTGILLCRRSAWFSWSLRHALCSSRASSRGTSSSASRSFCFSAAWSAGEQWQRGATGRLVTVAVVIVCDGQHVAEPASSPGRSRALPGRRGRHGGRDTSGRDSRVEQQRLSHQPAARFLSPLSSIRQDARLLPSQLAREQEADWRIVEDARTERHRRRLEDRRRAGSPISA